MSYFERNKIESYQLLRMSRNCAGLTSVAGVLDEWLAPTDKCCRLGARENNLRNPFSSRDVDVCNWVRWHNFLSTMSRLELVEESEGPGKCLQRTKL